MRRRSFYFVAALMFCFGVLLPGFVLFGWTRNSRDVTEMINDGLGFVNRMTQSQPLKSARNSGEHNDEDNVDHSNFGGAVKNQVLSMDQVIIFGETGMGTDSTLNDDGNNATYRRDFIRKV